MHYSNRKISITGIKSDTVDYKMWVDKLPIADIIHVRVWKFFVSLLIRK